MRDEPVKLLFHGGGVAVGDGRRAAGLLAGDGRVLALGEPDALRRLAPDAEAVDVRGGLLVPGFVDSHVHFLAWALHEAELDLRDEATLEAAFVRIAAAAAALPPGAWLVGGRFDKNRWGGWPTAAALDAVTGPLPAVLRSRDGHARWLNSAALARAGITAATPDPPGGEIARDAHGAPTGILKETAARLADAVVPPPTPERVDAALDAGRREAWRQGLTGVGTLEGPLAREAFGRLAARGALGLRVYLGLAHEELDEAVALGLRTGGDDEWLRLGPLKLFVDGALGSQTAALEEPYLGTAERGIVALDPAVLRRDVVRAARAGLAVALHAIGDRAVHLALDAIAPARALAPGLRHRIEHAQLIRAEDLDRFAGLGVVASMQPIHATSDRELAERWWGPARTKRAYAWQTLLASGACLAFGSDAPVEPIDPLLGVGAAVTRRGPRDAEPWHPEQRLTIAEALAAYAAGPAWAFGRERELGLLAPGMRCDATILDRDVLALPPDEVGGVRVAGTVTGGVIRHAAGIG